MLRAAGIKISLITISHQSYMQRLLGLYGVDRYSPKSLSRRWIPSHHGSLRRKRSTVTTWENVTISHFVTKVTLRAAGCGAGLSSSPSSPPLTPGPVRSAHVPGQSGFVSAWSAWSDTDYAEQHASLPRPGFSYLSLRW